MKKTDKKIENTLVASLTEVCEAALKGVEGFQWITHLVNYSDYPKSLSVICVFDREDALARLVASGKDEYLRSLIKEALNRSGIPIKNIQSQVSFDTQEACDKQHKGKWSERLR